jgi:hypothetical protein
MRWSHLALAALLPLGVAATGCSKSKEAPAETKPQIAWPAKPAEGAAPVVVQFKEMTGEGKDRRAVFDVFNFSEENVSEFHAELAYLDKDGKVLKTFPHSQAQVFGGKEHDTIKAGFFMPPETVKVTATVRKVRIGEGKTWELEKK